MRDGEIHALPRQGSLSGEKGGIRFSMRSGKLAKTRAHNPKGIAKIQAASPYARILTAHDFIPQKIDNITKDIERF